MEGICCPHFWGLVSTSRKGFCRLPHRLARANMGWLITDCHLIQVTSQVDFIWGNLCSEQNVLDDFNRG